MRRGSISFGLVNIPAKVYPAIEDKEFSFNQLCPNGHRIHYKRWCPVDEKEVSYNEIKKGYEVSKDNYIAIDKKDLVNRKLKTTKTIDVKELIEGQELDPILIERSYCVAPDTRRGAIDKAFSKNTKRKQQNSYRKDCIQRQRTWSCTQSISERHSNGHTALLG